MAVIYYRDCLTEKSELEIMQKYFKCYDNPVGVINSLIIPRFSMLPFYKDQEKSFALQNSKLINSFHEHCYIANFHYYWDVENYTPKTWFYLSDVPKNAGPFVVKGITNSKKSLWSSHMYAETREDAIQIAIELSKDGLIGQQDIIVRKYEPMISYGIGINGRPWTNEWRCFYYRNTLLSMGFYWSEADVEGEMNKEGIDFANKIAKIISEKVNFFVIDIGQKLDGSWQIIECNDGSMSGLSLCDPEILYFNLKNCLTSNNNVGMLA